MTNLIIPALILTNAPAKNLYKIAKVHSIGSVFERPQHTNTEIVAPIADIKMAFVAWNRSQSEPIILVANTAEPFSSAKSMVPKPGERPNDCAYVGKYIEGRK